MSYSTDSDLVKIRPNILSLGVDAWADQHTEATAIINRTLIVWYKEESLKRGWSDVDFDATKLLSASTQLKRLACYKVFELAYMYLMQDSIEDSGFYHEMKLFQTLYETEFRTVLETGLDYDWDADGQIDDYEQEPILPRRLVRI